jgi:hypothetical protein
MSAAVSVAEDRWVKLFSRLVPGELRTHFLPALLQERREMRARGVKRWKIELDSAGEILSGLAQRAPLWASAPEPAAQVPLAEGCARAGWPLWRLAGPAMFLGHVTGTLPLVWIGAGFLLASLAALVGVVAWGREPHPDAHARFANAVFGGTLAALVLVLLFGAVTVALLLVASATGWGFLASFAVHAHALFATACACAVTGSGWVPEEWYPRRLAPARRSAER